MRPIQIGLAVSIALANGCWTPVSAEPVLERVIMVSRHGVRAPTRTAKFLTSLTKRGWPEWPGGAGEMTAHGAKALGFMADFLHATYGKEHLLPDRTCPKSGAVEVWADALDGRTRKSGDIFADRLAPGCGLKSRYQAGGSLDPLFDASKSEACPVGLLSRGGALLAAARQSGGLLRPEDRRSLETLQHILAPDACAENGPGICLVPDKDASTVRTGTSLTLGAMVAEGIYLEYVEGLPLTQVGWGNVSSDATIDAIMPVFERGAGMLRGTPLLAATRGIVLARTILAFLQGRPLPTGAPALSRQAKLVMLAGHDSNLLYLAALMGLDWRFPGQPTMTPPDATLAFEAWYDPATGRHSVKVLAYAQTMKQLRDATPLDATDGPDVVPIVPEACAGGSEGCDLAAFAAGVERKLVSLCNG